MLSYRSKLAERWGRASSCRWASGPPGWTRLRYLGRPQQQQAREKSEEDQAGGELERMRRLEAALFLAREPLSSRKLSLYANLADGTEARTLVRRLNQQYDEGGRAFRVEEFAGGYQLLTRPKLATWLRRLGHVPGETRLSAPAVETLAVIAYRQPVLRADIEAVRGVNCGEILRQLMDRDLVRIGGRSHELGRPYLYTTTRRFLQMFGLQSLDKLPRAEVMRQIPTAGASNPNKTALFPTTNLTDVRQEEESDVSATAPTWHLLQNTDGETLRELRQPAANFPRQSAEDDFDEEEFEDDEEDDEEEDDVAADEEIDEELDEEEDFDDEWEEVEDDEDEDWEDDEDDWDDDGEEEEEDEEWE